MIDFGDARYRQGVLVSDTCYVGRACEFVTIQAKTLQTKLLQQLNLLTQENLHSRTLALSQPTDHLFMPSTLSA
jgi:hypothetical protein